jgi:hypothetical protein
MPISDEELYEYLEGEGRKLANGGVLADIIREYIRKYYHETHKTPVMLYAIWEMFKRSRTSVEKRDELTVCRNPPFIYVKELNQLWRYNYKKEKWTEVKDSYFRGIIRKAWETYIDEEGVMMIHLNKQKKLRIRKLKVG